MSDRKPIESYQAGTFSPIINICRTSEVRKLETEHNEHLSKAEELENRYQQKCKMFNSQSAVLRLKEEKIRDLKRQRDIAVELLDRVVKQGGIHTVTSMDIVEFLAGINQIGEK